MDEERWDVSPGDVIAAYADGSIVLDDGITTYHPLRACAFLAAESDRQKRRAEAAEQLAHGGSS